MASWDYIMKFIVLGDPYCGKSSLLVQLTDKRFLGAAADPTIGVEFGSRLITLPESGKVIKLQIWDTAGQESFRSITRSYYRGASGALLTFDVTRRSTFQNVRTWLEDLRQWADEDLLILLVGNKVDLVEEDDRVTEQTEGGEATSTSTPSQDPQSETTVAAPSSSSSAPIPTSTSSRFRPKREVTKAEATDFAEVEGLAGYIETSAKTGHNVEAAFERAARLIHERAEKDKERLAKMRGRGVGSGLPLLSGNGGKAGGCC